MAETCKKKMTRISKFFLVLCITFPVLSAGLGSKNVGTKIGAAWSPDEKVPGYLDDTFTPFLLTDHNRTVHAFTSQWVENDGRRLAIVYRRWSLLVGWTRPVDIILSPLGGDANFMSAYLDPSDTMHVVFTATEALTRKTYVYYSSAPAASADWSPAWSTPMIVGEGATELNSGAIIGDEYGNLVVIYSGNLDGSGVYSIYSTNTGDDWSIPQPVFLTNDSNLSAFSLHLTIGPDQSMKAVWNVVTNLGVDESLYFANFDSQNLKWETPVELEKRIDLPAYFGPSYPVIVDNGQVVVVIYNNGNPYTGQPVGAGRPIQRSIISVSNGLTWNEPSNPFPFHVGRSGEHALVLDGNGTPHTIFTQRIENADEAGKYKIIGGIWHSAFENGGWTNPDRFITQIAPHDIRAVVCQGNVLLVVWREDPGAGQSGVWYSYNVLNTQELPVVPLSTAPVDYLPTKNTAIATTVETSTLVPSPQPELLGEAPPSNLGSNPALPIIIGTIPVLLILIGVIMGYRYISNRNV